MTMVSVEQIIQSGQLIESELQAQAKRLIEVMPRDEDEAVYLTDLMDGYRQAAVYVNRLWTHQQKRMDKITHLRNGTSRDVTGIDGEGRAVAFTEDGEITVRKDR